jgi:hypothetical protein
MNFLSYLALFARRFVTVPLSALGASEQVEVPMVNLLHPEYESDISLPRFFQAGRGDDVKNVRSWSLFNFRDCCLRFTSEYFRVKVSDRYIKLSTR